MPPGASRGKLAKTERKLQRTVGFWRRIRLAKARVPPRSQVKTRYSVSKRHGQSASPAGSQQNSGRARSYRAATENREHVEGRTARPPRPRPVGIPRADDNERCGWPWRTEQRLLTSTRPLCRSRNGLKPSALTFPPGAAGPQRGA